MGQFLIATKEILHLLSIEETSGENAVRYSLGLPKSCGCRHDGTRGAPKPVKPFGCDVFKAEIRFCMPLFVEKM